MIRRIARLLTRIPYIKKHAKWFYLWVHQVLFFAKIRKKLKSISLEELDFISYRGMSTFFGYYDKSPVNKEGEKLIFCASSLDTAKSPKPSQAIEIVSYDFETKSYQKIGQSYAYNWQQGCRLQWVDNVHIIFNVFNELRLSYESILVNCDTKEIKKRFDLPVQDSFQTEYFLSLNYRRLRTMRPDYGYFNLAELNENEISDYQNDGIWKVDIKTGDSVLLISLSQIIAIDQQSIFEVSKHWVNHIMISPSGEKFVFLHRYFFKNRKFDRLFIADSNGQNLRLLPSNEMISHYSWVDDTSLIGYMRNQDGRDHYYILDTNSSCLEPFESTLLSYGDGHPSYDKETLITDTYPDKFGFQRLICIQNSSGRNDILAEFHHPLKFFKENRCDLHPRVVLNKVYFDTVHDGKRRLGWLSL